MIQYKDPDGVLRPIPANYKEETRNTYKPPPYISYVDRFTYCKCEGIEKCYTCVPIKNRYTDLSTISEKCSHFALGLGYCGLSMIDEVDLINSTPREWLPALLGPLQSEMGLKELEKRLNN